MREFLNSRVGRGVGIAIVILGIFIAAWSIYRNTGYSDGAVSSNTRWYVDEKTGKAFRHDLKIGEQDPVVTPDGNKSGYPAELCNWTKDGKVSDTLTPVLVKSTIGKSGPTFCPVCGRLVVFRNPQAGPNAKPPPTEAEYKSSNFDE